MVMLLKKPLEPVFNPIKDISTRPIRDKLGPSWEPIRENLLEPSRKKLAELVNSDGGNQGQLGSGSSGLMAADGGSTLVIGYTAKWGQNNKETTHDVHVGKDGKSTNVIEAYNAATVEKEQQLQKENREREEELRKIEKQLRSEEEEKAIKASENQQSQPQNCPMLSKCYTDN